MNSVLIKNLIDFGLSEKEARVYVATLELEVATANEIAKKSEVNRSSTYVIIESLEKQGLVSETESKTIKQYATTPPEILLNLAKKMAEKHQEIRKTIESIVPSLETLHKDTKHKPKVFVYEGEENVKALCYKESSSLKSGDIWRVFEDAAEYEKYLPGFIEKDKAERLSKGIKLHGINPNTKGNQELVRKYKNILHHGENLLIPVNKFKSSKQSIDFAVYGDEISFASLPQSFAIVIKHQQIADTLKNIFDLAWKEAKRLDQKKVNERSS